MVTMPLGNPVETWAATIGAAPGVRLADLARDRQPGTGGLLVVVGAHPDDETIGAGRFVAEWTRTVGPAVAFTVTAGEACLDHLGVLVPGLADRREAEWHQAVAALGCRPVGSWRVADGTVDQHVEAVAERLGSMIGPGDVVLAPWRHDPHPDHAAAGEAAALAALGTGATLVEYPVWMTVWADPEILERTQYHVVRVEASPAAADARVTALAHYETIAVPQRADVEAVVPPTLLEHYPDQLALVPGRRSAA